MKIRAGETVVLTHGEYSGYEVFALGRARVDIDADQVSAQFTKEQPKPRGTGLGDYCREFGQWLIDECYVGPVPFKFWHMGAGRKLEAFVTESEG